MVKPLLTFTISGSTMGLPSSTPKLTGLTALYTSFLLARAGVGDPGGPECRRDYCADGRSAVSVLSAQVCQLLVSRPTTTPPTLWPLRSEERRVGKECRSRWSRYHCNERIYGA